MTTAGPSFSLWAEQPPAPARALLSTARAVFAVVASRITPPFYFHKPSAPLLGSLTESKTHATNSTNSTDESSHTVGFQVCRF